MSIIHNGGVVTAADHAKLKVISDLCKAGAKIAPAHDEMHKIFIAIKQAIGELILKYTGRLPGAPAPNEIVDLAIQEVRRS